MEETDFPGAALLGRKIAIWGLGLMGGSLAMALQPSGAQVVGIDHNARVVAAAVDRGIVSSAFSDPAAVWDGLDLLVLAVPVRSILAILTELPQICPKEITIIDLGSTKRQVVQVMDALPERFQAVGGHPMCGKEVSGLEAAAPSIYVQAPFALVSTKRTTSSARALVEALAGACRACPLWVDADDHDRWVAATSHAPLLLASALASATPLEASPLIGPGFRSTTRLARSGAGAASSMVMDMLETNSDYILSALLQIAREAASLQRLLADGQFSALALQLAQNAEHHHRLLNQLAAEEGV